MSSLKIYNTLKRGKEVFKPLKAGKVGMYVCGVTVYSSSHLGHARAALSFDMIAKYLLFSGFEVNYVCNYTDVDDKIIARAVEEGVTSQEISERYIKEYEADMAGLSIKPPTVMPKATQHIAEMITMIEKLIAKDMAYEVNGSVFYSVRKFKDYGKLSGKKIDDLESGMRIEVDEEKKDPLDFALWKPAKEGEPAWDSPWGKGRPGWHIECSAMSCKYLGETFDIHGGGRDIQFPHHENEIAQSEGASGKEFSRYWIHNGMIQIDKEKMSKSIGNVANIQDMLSKYDAEEIRLFVFSNHYRSSLDYNSQAMYQARESLDRYYETVARVLGPVAGSGNELNEEGGKVALELQEKLIKFEDNFTQAMNDDFNTAQVTGFVFDIVRLTNRYIDISGGSSAWLREGFSKMQHSLGRVLGVFGSNPVSYQKRLSILVQSSKGVDAAEIEGLLAKRAEARSNKDFATSDQIRDQLLAMGVEIKDAPGGKTEWKLK